MGNIKLSPTHTRVVNNYMLGKPNKEIAHKAGLSLDGVKWALKQPDVKREIRRRTHKMEKYGEQMQKELIDAIVADALYEDPDLARLIEEPEAYLRELRESGRKIMGTIKIIKTPGARKYERTKYTVEYQPPKPSEIVALRNQAMELLGMKAKDKVEHDFSDEVIETIRGWKRDKDSG